MFKLIESGKDQYGNYEIAQNTLTEQMYKRITCTKRDKTVWTDWYKI